MKDERGDKVITKFEAKSLTLYYWIQKDQKGGHKKENSEFIRVKGVKKLVSKELPFSEHQKCFWFNKSSLNKRTSKL